MRWLLLLVLFLGGCAHKEFHLRVLHINDTHSHLEPIEYKLPKIGRVTIGGYGAIASYVKSLNDDHLLFLHAGDALQGTLYYTLFRGEADAAALNTLGLDAQTLGNHEFDDGAKALRRFLARLSYPVVSANVKGLDIKPYIIKHFGSERVAIVGLSVDASKISKPGPTVAFADYMQRAKEVVQELKLQKINKIIFLTHLGIRRDKLLAKEVQDIDLIVGGHSHTLLGDFSDVGLRSYGSYPLKIGKSLIVQAWKWGMVVGDIDLWFDERGVIQRFRAHPTILVHEKRLAQKYKSLTYSGVDAATQKVIAKYKERVQKLQQTLIGEALQDLWHRRLPCERAPNGEVLTAGSLIAPLVALSMKEQTGADIAIQNAGGVRKSILQGPISVGDVMELLPFGNTLVLIRMRGEDIIALLKEQAAKAFFGKRSGAFPYLAGAKIVLDKEVKIEGIDPVREYLVVTNSFLAQGGAGYRFPKGRDSGYLDSEAMIAYIKRHKVLRAPAPVVEARCLSGAPR